MWPAVVTVLSQAERFEYLKYREVESWLFPIDRLVSRGKEGLGRWVNDSHIHTHSHSHSHIPFGCLTDSLTHTHTHTQCHTHTHTLTLTHTLWLSY